MKKFVDYKQEFAKILIDQLAGPVTSRQGEYLKIITSNSNRLANTIRKLLDIARTESGQVQLLKSFFDPEELIVEIVKSMRPFAESKKVDLFASLSGINCKLFADRVDLVPRVGRVRNAPLPVGQSVALLEDRLSIFGDQHDSVESSGFVPTGQVLVDSGGIVCRTCDHPR